MQYNTKLPLMRLSIIGIITVLLLIASCTKDEVEKPYSPGYQYPVSAFSYSGNNGAAPVTIQFTNHSETIHVDSVRYLWKFGENGAESIEKNPVHTFHNTGSNNKNVLVKLTVFDLISDLSQTKSQNIVIAHSK